jgi:phospholipase C
MYSKRFVSTAFRCARIGLGSLALFQFTIGASLAGAAPQHQTRPASRDNQTTSPIKHVIVIIGENRSFDHVFATYVPKNGQTVNNLLSERIITLDQNKNAIAGPNWDKAHQLAATDTGTFLLDPPKELFPNDQLPAPLVGGPGGANGYFSGSAPCPAQPALDAVQCAEVSENGLPSKTYYNDLASGGSGLTSKTPDTRIANVEFLPAGPFQLTNSLQNGFDYNAYAASPVHRFYQMWQQENCSIDHAAFDNPSGCNAQLFSWVEVTVGAGTNGVNQKPLCSSDSDHTPCFTTNYLPGLPGATTTGEGSTALGFYNVQQGDVPYFKSLADTYAMSDNFHQSVDGGTGANHIMFGHADAIYFYDPNSATPYVPPENVKVYNNAGNPDAGVVNEIENPNPERGTNNWYVEDGYGSGGFGSPVSGGGSYSNCSDPSQPGVGPIVSYLRSIGIDPRCQPGHYYLLNNYNPGFFGSGANAYTDQNPENTPFTIPPSSTPGIGDDLNAAGISWKYYGDQWNDYAGVGTPNQPPCAPPTLTTNCYIAPDPYQLNYGTNGATADEYCNICNPFQYDRSIMGNPAQIAAHIQDTLNLYSDIENDTLPAVSIVKPSGYVDGHPASSKLDLFEGFTQKIVQMIHNSQYWNDTAIFITEDEGGGYYDSGYVQPLDFFGDGTRIIFLVVSKFSTGGYISHAYADHVSIDKFIERNWNLPPITDRSRDNFANPVTTCDVGFFHGACNPYVPLNRPAISDLFDFFNFGQN